MLVKERFKEGETYIFKLVSGEEIVGKIKEYDAQRQTVDIRHPLEVNIVTDRNGQKAKALLPWLMLSPDGTPTLELVNILGSLKAPKEVEDAYLEHTTSIVLAK
jgi:hypothetical protein